MGYEVTYKYHERKDGSYDKEELKSLKKKVGDPFEEVPLEKLAGAVMAQLARRDIFVVDVDIVELSRKQISFKETNGGVVIKNRKFLFDQASSLIVQQVVEVPENNTGVSAPQERHIQHVQNSAPAGDLGRPIDVMIFSPELPQMPEIKKKGLRLTPDKKYPVYGREQMGAFTVLKIIDDVGRQQNVSDVYFIPGNVKLLADRELGFSETQKQRDGGKLNWGGAVEDDSMPVIRR
jgi:hypothetical protein